jgi:hypothetical protein
VDAADLVEIPARRLILFGCGAAFLLILLAALAFLWVSDDLLGRTLGSLQTKVEARVAAEVPETDRTRLAWAFTDARRAVEAGRTDADERRRVLEHLALLARRPREEPLSRDEVRYLAAELESLAGVGPPPGSAEPDGVEHDRR